MASAATPAKAYYGPINPAILGGFDWDEEEDVQSSASTAQSQPQGQRTASNPATTALFTYRSFNSALLSDIEDDAVSLASGMATDGGSVAGENAGETDLGGSEEVRTRPTSGPLEVVARRDETQATKEKRPPWSPYANRAISGQSNNPYAAAIEAKQNAMTMAFLRSPTAATPIGIASSLAPDDLGYVAQHLPTNHR